MFSDTFVELTLLCVLMRVCVNSKCQELDIGTPGDFLVIRSTYMGVLP